MVRHLRHRATTWALALTMGFAGLVASTPAVAASSQDTTYAVSIVRVVVREADGGVYRAPTRAVRSGDEAAFEVISDLHRHTLALTPSADSGIEFSYARDGAVLQSDGAATVSGRRTAVFQDNGATIEVSVVPTVVTVGTEP